MASATFFGSSVSCLLTKPPTLSLTCCREDSDQLLEGTAAEPSGLAQIDESFLEPPSQHVTQAQPGGAKSGSFSP